MLAEMTALGFGAKMKLGQQYDALGLLFVSR